jgi:hypothetical protein
MYICVTHIDAKTKIPSTEAPMSHGPKLPDVKGLVIEWANWTQWPTNTPYFYGTCDEDADVSISGVVKVLSEEQYQSAQNTETHNMEAKVRMKRDDLLKTEIDSLNPIRWESLTEDQKTAYGIYRQELLDVPQQDGFPFNVDWPVKP